MRKHDGSNKLKGGKLELINFDHKNETNPLRQETAVRKTGGLFLSPNGVKVEIPPGASTGRRERLLCSSVSSTARGALGPWLGTNLRMASDMQIFYAPVNFKQSVAVFIPFSFAATREMSFPVKDETNQQEKIKSGALSANEDTAEGDFMQAGEMPHIRATKHPPKTRSATPMSFLTGQQKSKNPPLIDTRNVFVLQCRLGEDMWTTMEKFVLVQPTIHHNHWPMELKKLVVQSARWPDTSYAELPQTNDPTLNTKRFSGSVTRSRRAGAHPVKENDSLDLIRRMDNFCGGVCFAAEELCHCYLLVVGARAEHFHVNPNGGYYRSPLLHPFLSVRVPKRSCLEERTAAFRALDIRSNWAQGATQFDPQLSEIEGCSDIYELDLPDVTFRRSATVRLPLPHWFIKHRYRSHDNWDQTSTTLASSEVPEPSGNGRVIATDGTIIVPERPIVILYQPTGSKRQIVWQMANVEDTREDFTRRKSRIAVTRKDGANTPRCKTESLFCRLGWGNLTVGVRGGPWQVLKQQVYYTQRTAFFETNILGRFVLVGARDPERTTASKLAHLMSRVEALAFAPPGALLICLQLQLNSWKIMADVYPEERLADAIQEQVAAGFIPLVQMSVGMVRKNNGLYNAMLQTIDFIQQHKEGMDIGKARKSYQYRVNGTDINHVLLFNGLCLEFRVTEDVQIKPTSQCDAMLAVLKIKDTTSSRNQDTTEQMDNLIYSPGMRSDGLKRSLSGLFAPRNVAAETYTMLTKQARMQHHELLHETACVVEIEPKVGDDSKYTKRSMEKAQLVTELLKLTSKRQETGHDEEDSEDDDESDDHPGRRSSNNDAPSQASYDGDDGDIDDALKEAIAMVLREQPLPLTVLNAELLRRLNNISERNKVHRAADLINKIHNLMHVGTVEVWLVSPESLPKLGSGSEMADTNKRSTSQGLASNQSDATSTPPLPSGQSGQKPSESEVKTEVDAPNSDEQNSEEKNEQESHNAIRWNPSDNTGLDTVRSLTANISESGPQPRKALATYNILIDPDVVVGYLRSQQGRGGIAAMLNKKGIKGKQSMTSAAAAAVTSRPRSQQKGQHNVSAITKQRARSAAAAMRQVTPDTLDLIAYSESVDPAIHEELRILSNSCLQEMASYFQEPQQLAEALGLPAEEYNRIKPIRRDQEDLARQTYEVLKIWKKCYAHNRIQLSVSRCASTHDGDTNTYELYRSPLSDLIDVFQSLGSFEVVEMLCRLKENI
ncbi:hypothetical protein FGIG_02170 [Fasciola gigantica]|uniref:Death domain-containing protein n=1 Tax=Fasciola gigantica TaxID=46835 RepID=A0A504Y861_FASGI|nr:hypothetical protein FGIG_02170 [Fasciola gigantica]